jgi:clan AA aspartic protease
MITGEVTPWREAIVPLLVRGPAGQEIDAVTVLDTGFTEFLTLSPAEIASLGLTYRNDMEVVLADGAIVRLRVFKAAVVWNGSERTISVHEADGGPLIGMSLLYGHDVRLQIVDGGPVTIEPLGGYSPLSG